MKGDYRRIASFSKEIEVRKFFIATRKRVKIQFEALFVKSENVFRSFFCNSN